MVTEHFLGFGACILLLLLAVKRLWPGNRFLQKYALWWDGIIFGGMIFLLGTYFFQKNMKTGVLAVGLGGAAMGKYLYDKNNDERGNENQE